MSLPVVRASVRQVVETTYHDSDLSPAAGAQKRMREGAAAHRARQSEGAKREKAYQAEQALSADYEADTLILHVSGRADGLFTREDGVTVVEEIKLGVKDNPLIPAHRAQAAIYGHMLCARDGLSGVRLRVLYVDEQGEGVACYEEDAEEQTLQETFRTLCAARCGADSNALCAEFRQHARVFPVLCVSGAGLRTAGAGGRREDAQGSAGHAGGRKKRAVERVSMRR